MISDRYIINPSVDRKLKFFDELREKKRKFNKASCGIITGESGSGKSAIAKYYLELNPIVEEEELTRIPVMYHKLRSVANEKDFYIEALGVLKAPEIRKSDNKNELRKQLNRLIKTTNVELIIFDETQVIVQNRSKAIIPSLADMFKDLIDDTNIPIVIMGMPWTKYLLFYSEQLRTRVSYEDEFPTFSWHTPTQQKEYRILLKMLCGVYGISSDLKLDSKEMAARIFCFTKGNMRVTVELLDDFRIKCQMHSLKQSLNVLAEVVRERKPHSNIINPILAPVGKLQANELMRPSDYKIGSRNQEKALVEPEYATYGVTDDWKLYSVA